MPHPKIPIGALIDVYAPKPRASLQGQAQAQVVGQEPGDPLRVEVPDLWPGERAQVRVLARSRHRPRLFAKVNSYLERHPQRVDPPCEHHPGRGHKPACGGCPWMSLEVAEQRAIKAQVLSAQLGHPVAQVHGVGPTLGYRQVSKRVVGRVRGTLSLGSYLPRTHDLASMRTCAVDHPQLRDAFALTEDLLIQHRVRPYDEKDRSGEIRYIWGKRGDGALHLTAIGAHPCSPQLRAALTELSERLGPEHAVSWQQQGSAGNAIRSQDPTQRMDDHAHTPIVSMFGESMPLDALGFMQPNPVVAQACYRLLLGLDEDPPLSGALALDLYAGSGVTTRALTQQFEEVRACERQVPDHAAPLVQDATAESFLREHLDTGRARPELVIANPPRTGLSPTVCELLCELAPDRLHVMSCGPDGLQRNLEHLRAHGYQLVRLEAFDPLVHTAHVELVAQLRRSAFSSMPASDS